jgi:hypothetical protein
MYSRSKFGTPKTVANLATLGVRSASALLDFDFADLAGALTILPLRAVIHIDVTSQATHYESQFRKCENP